MGVAAAVALRLRADVAQLADVPVAARIAQWRLRYSLMPASFRTVVRDRIVQAAVKTVLKPVSEADFLPASSGFRPRRAQHDALQVLIGERARGVAVETPLTCARFGQAPDAS